MASPNTVTCFVVEYDNDGEWCEWVCLMYEAQANKAAWCKYLLDGCATRVRTVERQGA